MTLKLQFPSPTTSSKLPTAMLQVGATWIRISQLEYGEDFVSGVTDGLQILIPIAVISSIEAAAPPQVGEVSLQEYLEALPVPLRFIDHVSGVGGWILSVEPGFVELAQHGSKAWAPISGLGALKLVLVDN